MQFVRHIFPNPHDLLHKSNNIPNYSCTIYYTPPTPLWSQKSLLFNKINSFNRSAYYSNQAISYVWGNLTVRVRYQPIYSNSILLKSQSLRLQFDAVLKRELCINHNKLFTKHFQNDDLNIAIAMLVLPSTVPILGLINNCIPRKTVDENDFPCPDLVNPGTSKNALKLCNHSNRLAI